MDYKKLSYDLLEDFLRLLVHYDMIKTFNHVCEKYNDLLLEVDAELMKEIEEANIPKLTDEQSEKMREEIFAKLKEKEIEEERSIRFLKAIFEED